MASPATPENNVAQKRAAGAITNDDDSDYGSDFSPEEELIVERLISGQQVPAIEDNPIINEFENHGTSSAIRLPRILGREQQSPLFKAAMAAERIAKDISNSVKGCEYPHLGNRIPDSEPATPSEAPPDQPKLKDTRSPLERFRTQPKKALSVTDLVSPAWCELQYWYTLTIHGRKRRTPAMKQGSVVHQKLEDQVHTTVKVDVESKEDAWGLRIWNVIQGLRTLRETGQTRELEIWGTIDGLVVNGIIDDISYICPDIELEESLTKSKDDEPLPMTDQTTIEDFFKRRGGSSLLDATRTQRRAKSNKIYLCDVKTRGVRTLPSGAAFRPTKMQLMLYHRLLLALATNTVDFSILTARYDLNAHAPFSDAFLAQVGSLNDEVFYDALTDPEDDSSFPSSQDSMAALLAHNSLSALWSLMTMEFQRTLPDGPASLGNILKAEYRSRDTGEITGSKTFAMDDKVLKSYLDHEMQWWKGQREAEGVTVEEAYKCRSCDFAETCEWRLKKVEAAIERARAIKMRKTSTV